MSIQPVVSRGGIHFAWCRWGEVPAFVGNHGRTSARTENFAGTPLRCCWIVAGVRVVTGVYFGSLFVSANWLPRVDNNDEILKSRLSRASQIQGWCFMKCVLHLIWLVRAALCNHLKKKVELNWLKNNGHITVFLNQPIDFCIILFKIIARVSKFKGDALWNV